ncbi:MAG: DNA polymerase III subunit beta [Synechococcus sp. TMED187]|uniref:DNA polymerase III subunit beta n=1 Tax=Synechococcus sp. UW105 TaxID=337067 RepID=UPI000B6C7E02|nr:DNA polymerase III subunit beta [Synechococcus sp. UW105]MAS27564.1 DNA polymerase III subunit beta [Synechococcus sp. NAT40]OUW48111.1 MAG: DNA polymerase III subunit beta [Synechococcus sp. TMED187]
MKLVCSQAELNTALQLVSRAVASRPTHPVLANVLLTADAGTGRLSLTGFDLNLGIQTSLSASVEASGAVTLPARLLGEIVSRLSVDSPITLATDEASEQVELTSLSGSYQMRAMPADEFPDLPLVENGTALRVDAVSLVQALRGTLFASSADEAKQLLTGVHLRFEGRHLEAASTDGHRLAVLTVNDALQDDPTAAGSAEGITSDDGSLAVTLPARSLREVERLIAGWKSDDPVTLFYDRGQVVVLAADQMVTSRTLEGTYPNYRQLIPDGFTRTIDLERRPFMAALERVAVLADQHNNVVRISTDPTAGLVQISADAQDVGSGSESLPATLTGEAVQIAFNVRYVLDGLKAMEGDRISLQCNAPTTPAILTPADNAAGFTYLVMPVQIRN